MRVLGLLSTTNLHSAMNKSTAISVARSVTE